MRSHAGRLRLLSEPAMALRLVAAYPLLVLLTLLPGLVRGQERGPQASGPTWASSQGWEVFAKSGCGQCHSLRGVGGRRASDLAALAPGTGFFEVAAAVWNHVARLGIAMWETGVERQVTPQEVSAVLSFIFTAQYLDASGDRITGERLFSMRGCAACHAPERTGDGERPALDRFAESNSSVLLAAAMWNHRAGSSGRPGAGRAARSKLAQGELRHIVTHIVGSARATDGGTGEIVAETPRQGARVFAEKGCVACHTAQSRLGRSGRRVTLLEFAERMWNHDPVANVRLAGQEMAALVAYLQASRYFDGLRGDVARGRALITSKGCMQCHAVYGKGGKLAPDFAASNVVGSVEGQVAAMWNHGRSMKTAAARHAVLLPQLTGSELADIATYLGGLGRAPRRSR